MRIVNLPIGVRPETEGLRRRRTFILLCQILVTSAILGLVPGNLPKLATMVAVWALTFGRISQAEFVMMAGVNLCFLGMNQAALARGIFVFNRPDLFGLPIYEYVMWGFYILHEIRLLGGPPPRGRPIAVTAAAVLFALPFATIADPALLLLASAAILAGCFVLFHDLLDWAYAGYMAAVGALIEHVGVGTDQWHYPDQPHAAVPLWFICMWAGIGLFARRLILPLL